jgi:hypothetical protein
MQLTTGGNIDDFSARGSEPMLQRLDTQEVAAGVSWESQHGA